MAAGSSYPVPGSYIDSDLIVVRYHGGSPCEVVTTSGEVTGFAANGQEVNLPKDLHKAIDSVSTQPGHQLSLYTWFGSTKSFAEAQGSLDLDPDTQVKKVKCETLEAPEPPPAPVSPCEVINMDGEVIGFAADGQEVKSTPGLTQGHRSGFHTDRIPTVALYLVRLNKLIYRGARQSRPRPEHPSQEDQVRGPYCARASTCSCLALRGDQHKRRNYRIYSRRPRG